MSSAPESPNPSSPFRGMLPILPTALSADGTLDDASQRRVVQYCLACDARAIGHFGIASEFHKISDRDRTQLIRLIVGEVAGRMPVFIGVTAAGFGSSLEYAREAEDLGADLVMAALPFVDLPSQDDAFRFYEQLSAATSLPIIVQDTPAGSAILTAELLWRMASDIEHVVHVKAEGKNFLEKTAQLLEMSDGKLSVIGGAGGRHLIHLLRLGVTSFMTGTEALELHGGAVSAFLEGDKDRAAEIYFQQILPYLEFYLDYPEELLKSMLFERGVLNSPAVIAPRAASPMSSVERREFDWVLERIGWKKQWPNIP